MRNAYLTGNTIRLTGEFFDQEEVPIDVQLVKVIIYDYKYTKLSETILNSSNKISTGNYVYDYTVATSGTKIIYEFYGELNGIPALNRGQFVTKFI